MTRCYVNFQYVCTNHYEYYLINQIKVPNFIDLSNIIQYC